MQGGCPLWRRAFEYVAYGTISWTRLRPVHILNLRTNNPLTCSFCFAPYLLNPFAW
jgi:hypothetical protein